MKPLIILLVLILVYTILPTLFWYWVVKKGWATLRLLTVCIALSIMSLGAIIWFSIREWWVVIMVVVLVIWAGLIILTLPRSAPDLYKKLNIKW